MKSIAFITFFFLAFSAVFRSQNAGESKDNRFASYSFGSSPAENKDIVLEIDEGNTKLYSTEQVSGIQGVNFSQINLTFSDNKLSSIALTTKGSSAHNFLSYIKEKYGSPARYDAAKGFYEWKNGSLRLVFEKIKGSEDARVTASSLSTGKSPQEKK